jgi:CubicO group peptidase (beta-lactamase class C family)
MAWGSGKVPGRHYPFPEGGKGVRKRITVGRLVTALALCAAAMGAEAVPLGQATRKALDGLVQSESQIDRGGFGAILFTDHGAVWTYASGAPDPSIPFGKDTPLMVGELSGRFVILAAAQLAGRRLLDFDRPLRAYLPELDGRRAAKGHLPELARLKVGIVAAEATGRVDAIPRLVPGYRIERNLLPALAVRAGRFQPGFRLSRSCGMDDLLALLLERARRQPWQRIVAREAFRPLGMGASSFVPPLEAARDLAFYFRDGARCDPRLLESLLPPLAPSLSMRTSLADLASGGSSLLAAFAARPWATLPSRLAQAVLAPAIPGQLDRQGFASGLGWNLTDYRLGYLGRVAWAYGAAFTHQALVMLLPDQGLGIVLAGTCYHPAGLFDLKRMARNLLQTYAERERGIPRPAFAIPAVILPVPEADRPVSGLYASERGVADVGFARDLLTLSVRGGYGEFAWAGGGRFAPVAENEFQSVAFAGARMTVTWRSGARMELDSVPAAAQDPALERGTFRVEGKGSVQGRGMAMIDQREGRWTITADDGQSYLLLPDPPGGMRILCDPASALDGCKVRFSADGATHVLAP